jgi:predicted RNA-binding Zn-ribbon protein involved in translation (DUF1610 family)
MRVRKAATGDLLWKHLCKGRMTPPRSHADDVQFLCGACGGTVEVTTAVASDPYAVFWCPSCGEWNVRVD